MVNDHFADLLTGPLNSPLIWECTRFCLAPGAESRIAAALVQTANEVMEQFALTHVAAVFDARMERIYRRIGHAPEVLGSRGRGRERISLGLWSPDPVARARVAARSGVTPAQMTAWFDRSLGRMQTNGKRAEIA